MEMFYIFTIQHKSKEPRVDASTWNMASNENLNFKLHLILTK